MLVSARNYVVGQGRPATRLKELLARGQQSVRDERPVNDRLLGRAPDLIQLGDG